MIKSMTAFTLEIDQVDLAVQEILTQLDLEKNLKKNSVGLLSYYIDFWETGVVTALCERLPFDVIGATTPGSVVPGCSDQLMLSLLVLTSDEVAFAAGISASLEEGNLEVLDVLYADLVKDLTLPPAMMIVYQPMLASLSGDLVANQLGNASGGLPVFGTLALHVEVEVEKGMTCYNGAGYQDRLALLVIAGDVHPRFLVESFPGERTLGQKAVINKTQGRMMVEINNMPAVKYMERIGMIQNGKFSGGYMAIPVAIDYNDGTKPKTCSFYGQTPEGAIICGSDIPSGVTLAFGSLNHEDVIQTTNSIIHQIKQESGWDVLLIFSCFSRNVVLNDPMAEMDLALEQLSDLEKPFLFVYSGGEICPLTDREGRFVNRFHNYSIIVCLF